MWKCLKQISILSSRYGLIRIHIFPPCIFLNLVVYPVKCSRLVQHRAGQGNSTLVLVTGC